MPQGVLPQPPANNAPENQAAAPPAARLRLGACFNCPARHQARKLVVTPEPEEVKVTAKDVTDGLAENYSEVRQCTYSGVFDHIDSQCAEAPANPCAQSIGRKRSGWCRCSHRAIRG